MKKQERQKKPIRSSTASAKNDIERLKAVTRKMLDRLEQALAASAPGSEEEASERQKLHDWIFGQKTSLAVTLISLAELVFKLEETGSDGAKDAARTFSVADAALVEAFLCRVRDQESSAAPPAVS